MQIPDNFMQESLHVLFTRSKNTHNVQNALRDEPLFLMFIDEISKDMKTSEQKVLKAAMRTVKLAKMRKLNLLVPPKLHNIEYSMPIVHAYFFHQELKFPGENDSADYVKAWLFITEEITRPRSERTVSDADLEKIADYKKNPLTIDELHEHKLAAPVTPPAPITPVPAPITPPPTPAPVPAPPAPVPTPVPAPVTPPTPPATPVTPVPLLGTINSNGNTFNGTSGAPPSLKRSKSAGSKPSTPFVGGIRPAPTELQQQQIARRVEARTPGNVTHNEDILKAAQVANQAAIDSGNSPEQAQQAFDAVLTPLPDAFKIGDIVTYQYNKGKSQRRGEVTKTPSDNKGKYEIQFVKDKETGEKGFAQVSPEQIITVPTDRIEKVTKFGRRRSVRSSQKYKLAWVPRTSVRAGMIVHPNIKRGTRYLTAIPLR